jgi:hypothetical protein
MIAVAYEGTILATHVAEKREVVANGDHPTRLKCSLALPITVAEHGALIMVRVLLEAGDRLHGHQPMFRRPDFVNRPRRILARLGIRVSPLHKLLNKFRRFDKVIAKGTVGIHSS